MKIYKKDNGLFFDECGTLEEIAKLQNFEIFNISSFFEFIGEVVFKNNIQLTEEEIKEEIKKWEGIKDKIYNENVNKKEILDEILKYKFIVPLQYRDGEKNCVAFVNLNEDPIDQVSSWEDYSEFWEITFEKISNEDLYNILKEIYQNVI